MSASRNSAIDSTTGKGAAALLAAALLLLSSCAGTPNLADVDIEGVATVGEVAVHEAEAFRACMDEAGFVGFVPPVLGPHASSGVPIVIANLVDLVVADAATGVGDPNTELVAALSDEERQRYYDSFLDCDDRRVDARRETDSARGTAQAVLTDALATLHATPDYQTALRAYVACMRGAGWEVQDNGAAIGPIITALIEAVADDSPVGPGAESDLGFAGVEFDPTRLGRAREVAARLDAADADCGRDTLEPVYAPFNAEYGPLIAALYGIRPDEINRVRL